jgi:hypothetical protein
MFAAGWVTAARYIRATPFEKIDDLLFPSLFLS